MRKTWENKIHILKPPCDCFHKQPWKSGQVKMWKICHLSPRCSFVWLMNFMSGLNSPVRHSGIFNGKLYVCCVSFLSQSQWYMYFMYFTLYNQEIQNRLGNQMLACQDLLRHSQKCAGLPVSVKCSNQSITHLIASKGRIWSHI